MKISPTIRVETLTLYQDFKRSDPPVYVEFLADYLPWQQDLIRIANRGIDCERKRLAYETISLLNRFRLDR